MKNLVRSEPWPGGAWWEAELPEGWVFLHDKSIRNFLFKSPRESRLWVDIWDRVPEQYRQDWYHHLAPEDLTEFQKEAFQSALIGASNTEWDGPRIDQMTPEQREAFFRDLVEIQNRRMKAAVRLLTRHDLGMFVGFSYLIPAKGETGSRIKRVGYFVYYRWMIFIRFQSSSQVDTVDDENDAFAALASMRFREPAKKSLLMRIWMAVGVKGRWTRREK